MTDAARDRVHRPQYYPIDDFSIRAGGSSVARSGLARDIT
jgi:hypothetical protein